jgi:hypothetical protein
MKANRNEVRQRTATEVLELGEMLFDTAIEAATRSPLESEETDTSLIEEMHAAANEFFMALRLLLGTEQQFTSNQTSALEPQIPAEQDKGGLSPIK